MIVLAAELLAGVTGGGSSGTSVHGPGFSYEHRRSDYGKCIDTVKDETAKQYPSTKFLGLFGEDKNARPRAQATMHNMHDVCGLPPS